MIMLDIYLVTLEPKELWELRSTMKIYNGYLYIVTWEPRELLEFIRITISTMKIIYSAWIPTSQGNFGNKESIVTTKIIYA